MATYRSSHRFVRMSARKARLVVDLIRGKKTEQAASLLTFSKKRAAVLVKKVLDAAVTNAELGEADKHNLFVTEAFVDEGPTMKRFQPKDRGRAHAILKRTCHIHLAVGEKEQEASRGVPAPEQQAA
ncbi:MAG: 50S ribosomal protein L22 [Phycisphaerales bacterium]